MNATTEALRRQMLEWIAVCPRDHSEVMEIWRTSCPRLSIWEDACIDGLIDYEPGTGKVILSAAGKAFLLTTDGPRQPTTTGWRPPEGAS